MRRVLAALVLLLGCSLATAGTVGVAFDYTMPANVDGFRLYWGMNPDPATWNRTADVLELGDGSICTDPEADGTYLCEPFSGGQSPDVIPAGVRIWFVATAYNSAGESGDSNIVYKDYIAPDSINNLRFTP